MPKNLLKLNISQSIQQRSHLFRGATSKAILILIFGLLALYFARIFPPLASTDSYFHLSIGRWVWQHRQIPKLDEFTFVAQGQRWISNEWLSGTLLYLIYSQFGNQGIIALRVIVGLLTIFLIYQALAKISANAHLKLVIVLTAAVSISLRLLDRPEMFSFLIFALLFYLLESYRQKPQLKYLLPLPLIFLFWANIQGYAPIGIIVVGYYLGQLITASNPQSFAALVRSAISQKRVFLILFVLFAAATFTPGQFQRFFYAFYLNPDLFKVVTEVRPLPLRLAEIKYDFWQHMPLEVFIFAAIIALTTTIIIASWSKKTVLQNLINLLYFGFIFGLGFRYFRVIPLSILLCLIPLAQNLNTFQFIQKMHAKIVLIFLSASMLTLITAAVIQERIPLYNANYLFVFDKQGQIVVAASHSWQGTKPEAALQFIKENFTPRRILTSLGWSNLVLWKLQAKTKVFADIIYEKQTPETLTDYQNLSYGIENWQEAFNKYQPDIIINAQPLNVVSYFEAPVWEFDDYKLVYVDDIATVWTKDDQIKDKSLILEALKPYLASDLKFDQKDMAKAQEELQKLLAYNPKNAFVLNQLILINHSNKNYQEAEKLAEESIGLLPKDPNFPFLLAAAKTARGDCSKATQLLSQAKRLADGFYNIKWEIEKVASSCHLSI